MIRTDDIFVGAFALSRGGCLVDVEVCGVNGRQVAFFHIDGEARRTRCASTTWAPSS